MRRPYFIPLLILALLAALAWIASSRAGVPGASADGTLSVSGNVRVEEIQVLAPSLAATRTPALGQPVVAGRIASVEASAGVRVAKGAVIARLDDGELALQVEIAKAAARGARARVGVAQSGLDTLADNATKLSDARAQLDDTLAQLRASRAKVATDLAKAEALVRSLPPGGVPGTRTPPPGAPAGADPRVMVAKLKAALAQIDAGIAKVTAGRATLDENSAKLSDAKSQLRGAKGVLELVADAADAGVSVAEARRDLASVRAPYAGLITWAVEPGSVVFVGGPVARLLPDGPLLVDTYLDSGQLNDVRVGAAAEAGSDSWPGRTFGGRVTGIEPVYGYPPTSLPTPLIHMTRAFRVTVSIDDTAAPLPPGTPADLTIRTR